MAAIGQRARHPLLEQIVDLSAEALDDALAAALDAGVVVHVQTDVYRFRHALIQEAVDSELLPARRRRLHRRIAETLTRQPQLADGSRSSVIGELAYHWEAAGELEQSLAAAMAAGRAAQTLAAPAEAAAHYQRVLTLWDQVDDPEALAHADHPDVLMAAAEAAYLAGDLPHAVILAGTAKEEIDSSGGRTRQAVIRERLARFLWLDNQSESAIAICGEAVALVEREPPSPAKARVLAAHAQSLMLTNRNLEAMHDCEEAIEAARAVADLSTEGHATNSLGSALVRLGRWEEGIALLRGARMIAEQLGEPDELFRVYNNLFWPLILAGTPHDATEVAQAGVDHARRFGCMRSHGHYFQTCLVHALHAAGHLPEATSLLAEIEPPGGGFPKIWFLETSAQIALARGDIPSAVAAITAAMPIEGAVTYPHGTHFLPQAAEVSLAAGNITEARQRTDQACQLSSEKGQRRRPPPRSYCWPAHRSGSGPLGLPSRSL